MRKKSRFEDHMLMEVTRVGEDGITMHGNLYKDFNNVYGIAHGGYLYTVAHMAAEVCGELYLGGSWQVRSAECLFLHPLRNFPSVIHAVWISKDPAYPMVRAEVHDSKGALCFELNAALAPAWPAPAAAVQQIPKITTENMLPKTPDGEIKVPSLTSTFAKWLNIYVTHKDKERIVYSADLCEHNCDDYGFALPGAMFTAADCAAGGCLYYIDGKRPITVSANMHYLDRTVIGPVHAVPHAVRKGNFLNFYDVDLIDGAGKKVAVGQFIIRDMDKK